MNVATLTTRNLFNMLDEGIKDKWGDEANLIAFKPYLEHADAVGYTVLYVMPKGDSLEYVTHRAFIAKNPDVLYPFTLEAGNYFPVHNYDSESQAFRHATFDYQER